MSTTQIVSVRIPLDLLEQLDAEAERQTRTRSGQIVHWLRERAGSTRRWLNTLTVKTPDEVDAYRQVIARSSAAGVETRILVERLPDGSAGMWRGLEAFDRAKAAGFPDAQ